MANPRASRKNFKRQAVEQIKAPEKSWFQDFLRAGTRGENAPIGLGPRIPVADSAAQEIAIAQEAGDFAPGEWNRLSNPGMYGMDGRNTPTPVPRPALRQTVARPSAPSVYPTAAPQRSGIEEFFAANAAAPAPTRPTHQNRLGMLDAAYGAGDGYGRDY